MLLKFDGSSHQNHTPIHLRENLQIFQKYVYTKLNNMPIISIQFNEMHGRQTHIKFVSLHSKEMKPLESHHNRIAELQLHLQEALTHIEVLKQSNATLTNKVSVYQRKLEDMRIVEEQLEFRREEEKNMQMHLDNYQQLNAKLKEQINKLEIALKKKDQQIIKNSGRVPLQHPQTAKDREPLGPHLAASKVSTGRRSVGQKQNHPITPKSRVNINFDKLTKHQIDSIHQIKARRKVFL